MGSKTYIRAIKISGIAKNPDDVTHKNAVRINVCDTPAILD